MGSYGWRAAVTQGWRFARDELEIRLALRRNDETIAMARIEMTMTDHPSMVAVSEDDDTPWVVPRELAEVLFEALAPYMAGVEAKDLVSEVRRLRRERDFAIQRFDALLNGIGRCTAIASATDRPKGPPPLSHPV